MRLNHVNLVVEDLDGAQGFFRRSFGFGLLDRKGDAVAVMNDGQGFTLVLSNVRAFGGEVPVRYPEGFHVGFILETQEEVDRAHGRLVADGADIGREPRSMRDSYGVLLRSRRSWPIRTGAEPQFLCNFMQNHNI